MPNPIEAAARAIYEASPQDKPFSLLTASQREKPFREARAAIEAYERGQWVDAETCINDDGNEFITEDGSVVFWHDGNDNYWKLPGWYDVRDSILTGKPCRVKRLRPLPQPPESERGE